MSNLGDDVKERTAVFGRCEQRVPHDQHIFAIGVVDPDGVRVMQDCPGQHAECYNCDDRLCMACVFREVHDYCENDCPECCGGL